MPSAASLARGVAFFIASTGNQGVQAQLFPGETVEEGAWTILATNRVELSCTSLKVLLDFSAVQ